MQLTEVHLELFQLLASQNGLQITLDRGAHLFRQGDSDSRVFLVREGLLKAYYLRPDGREHIKSFVPEGSVIGSMTALIDGDACSFSLMALEATTVTALPYADLRDAAEGDLALANGLVAFLSIYGKRKEQREYQLLSLSPEDRYAILLETMPEVADRISQADMAAYIGVTPQALSRIRRRLRKFSAQGRFE